VGRRIVLGSPGSVRQCPLAVRCAGRTDPLQSRKPLKRRFPREIVRLLLLAYPVQCMHQAGQADR